MQTTKSHACWLPAEGARRYGFAEHVTDWHALIADERVQLFDNSGPNNLHAEPTIAAAEAGKHVICEKPLGRDAAESYETWQRGDATGVKHMCAFNYRFVPAERLARQIIEAGDIGEISHFPGAYLHEWGATDDAVWVTCCAFEVAGRPAGKLIRVDPARGKVTARITLPEDPLAVANLAVVVDPSLIVLAGAMMTQSELLVDEVRRVVRRVVPATPEIVVSALGKEAPLWGSLLMA